MGSSFPVVLPHCSLFPRVALCRRGTTGSAGVHAMRRAFSRRNFGVLLECQGGIAEFVLASASAFVPAAAVRGAAVDFLTTAWYFATACSALCRSCPMVRRCLTPPPLALGRRPCRLRLRFPLGEETAVKDSCPASMEGSSGLQGMRAATRVAPAPSRLARAIRMGLDFRPEGAVMAMAGPGGLRVSLPAQTIEAGSRIPVGTGGPLSIIR